MEKMDCLIDLVKNNIDLIDIRPLTKLQQALNQKKQKPTREPGAEEMVLYLLFGHLF